jgi:integrase
MRTSFPRENGGSASETKDSPNISGSLPTEIEQDVSFPKRLRKNGKGRVWATIYKRSDGSYRLYWRDRNPENGKPRSCFKDFVRYSEAKKAGDDKVSELAKSHQAIRLSPGQASDALAAFQRLQRFYEQTGRRITLLTGISEYCDTLGRLNGRSLGEAADGFLSSVATVKRKDLTQAVDEFITSEESRTKAVNGQRPQVSPKYAYNRAIMLRRFANALPGTAVCELAKEHLDAFIGGLANIKSKSRNKKQVTSAKGRNHHRAAIRQFLAWAARRDYLAIGNRLGEADAMRPEHANNGEIQFYTPGELKKLLDIADGSMRAMIALGGLGGLRTQELLRLDWGDVWRVKGHVEISAGKSKTRQRRLVSIVPALARWLALYKDQTAGPICIQHEITFQQHFCKLCDAAGVARKANGLRHGFCSYSYALHGEVWTAQQAGHAPGLLHAHYRGLVTKGEARKWFNAKPSRGSVKANVIQLNPCATGGIL